MYYNFLFDMAMVVESVSKKLTGRKVVSRDCVLEDTLHYPDFTLNSEVTVRITTTVLSQITL